MLITAHVATGIAIGSITGNPVLGFFSAFIVHHLIDAIPHSDPGDPVAGGIIENFKKDRALLGGVIIDATVGLVMIIIAIYMLGASRILYFSIFGSLFPDIIDNSPFWSPYLRKRFPINYYHRFHETFHFTIKDKKYLLAGYLTQILVIILSAYVVLK